MTDESPTSKKKSSKTKSKPKDLKIVQRILKIHQIMRKVLKSTKKCENRLKSHTNHPKRLKIVQQGIKNQAKSIEK